MKYEYKYDIFGMQVGVIPIADDSQEVTDTPKELPVEKKPRKKKGE